MRWKDFARKEACGRSSRIMPALRHLVVILGDQLDPESAALTGFDQEQDALWMAEVAAESTKVWSHKARIAVFLSGMRHYAAAVRQRGWPLHYRTLDDPANRGSLAAELADSLQRLKPEKVVIVQPGEWHVREALRNTCAAAGVLLEEREDTHFLCTAAQFEAHAKGRKGLRMEFFYRDLRQRTGLLMEADGTPAGGQWNFDHDNRGNFGKGGPDTLRGPRRFLPGEITKAVLELVEARFPDHPGKLAAFDWPVTPEDGLLALEDFIARRLVDFGTYQDAMWTGEPWLYHSRLSVALNLKLLHPLTVCRAAEKAWREGRAPLAAVEGFIRQILGWREYVRGIYWRFMPEYREMNALHAEQPLPGFYWTGQTEMRCLSQAIGQTLEYGYAHHIQRLMVTGLFALLLGVRPQEVHQWYLAVYVDAVEWVELPNTLGMSQYADGGIMASKPYAATGKYIQRMSNYCTGCPYNPAESTGPTACPFTTLYWDFLLRHEPLLRRNQRMSLQTKNLDRLDMAARKKITDQSDRQRARFAAEA